MRKVSEKSCRENQNSLLIINNFCFLKSCWLWDNMDKYCSVGQVTYDQMTRRIRFLCWINKATDTHSAYVTHIAFARQKWFPKRASIQRLYVHCLSCYLSPTCIQQLLLDYQTWTHFIKISVWNVLRFTQWYHKN